MRAECLELPNIASLAFPLKSIERPRSVSGAIGFGCLAALACAVLIPLFGLTAYGLSDPAVREQVLQHPIVAFEISAALMLWTVLFGWPLKQLFERITTTRKVEITAHDVCGMESGALGSRSWSAPLDAYLGIAHHIRSSLAGTRHEIVLVHPEQNKSVVLMDCEHILDADMARFAALLRLPQIPAKELYRFTKRRDVHGDLKAAKAWAAA